MVLSSANMSLSRLLCRSSWAIAKQLCLVKLSWAPMKEHCFVIWELEILQQAYLTMPQILQLEGLNYHSFTPEEAARITQRLIEDNQYDFGHQFPEKTHEIAVLTKYWYVQSQGTKKARKHSEQESVEKTSGDVKVIMKELDDAAGGGSVKLEIVVHVQLLAATQALRVSIKKLTDFPTEFQKLRAKVAAKSITEPMLSPYKDEIAGMVMQLQQFLNDAGDQCAVAEIVDPATEDGVLQGLLVGVQQSLQDAEAHLLGAKAAKGRFSTLLG